jgi:hypothetical protein
MGFFCCVAAINPFWQAEWKLALWVQAWTHEQAEWRAALRLQAWTHEGFASGVCYANSTLGYNADNLWSFASGKTPEVNPHSGFTTGSCARD